jgi:dUTP pyrophosphatase
MNVQLDPGAYMPDRAHVPDAGADLFTPVDFTLYGNSHKTIDTGVHIEIPYGYVGMVKSKSGLMLEGILTDGTVDSGYTGSIRVVLFNHSEHTRDFKAGEKIAQLVIMKIVSPAFEQVEKVNGGDRGDGGFGSTGR